jgi:hypothetical protein
MPRGPKGKKRYLILAVVFVAALAVYGLDRGIYIGSTTTADASAYSVGAGVNAETHTYTIIHKNCRYLFVTGITELPAHGGLATKGLPGAQFADEASSLHCRIFGE